MGDFSHIVAATAERLRALEISEIVYFHCDHFEPWDFSQRSAERAAQEVADFADAVDQVDFARRLTLFYSNPWNTRLSDEGDLLRAAPEDTLGFVRRSDAEHEILGAPFRYLRAHSNHEVQIHVHHENFTWTRGMRDQSRADYLRRDEARALDGPRFECAIEQWLESARREFDYVPTRWFFVHGLWALNGSDPEGCNIHDEIARLMKRGCRGDFTFPAGRAHCDPRFEAPYFCAPAMGPKIYDSAAAQPEFAWGNPEAAADKFFIWNSPIKAAAASLDWGDPGLRAKLGDPEPFAQEIIERSFRWDGVLFIKTHAHSMHRMNRDGEDRLVHPHCYGPTRDLYGAIFEAAGSAGATVTLATAGEVYDRFVGAPRPAIVPPMSSFRPSLVGKELGYIEPTRERVLDTAARLDGLATAAIAARVREFGIEGSGAEAHYAALAERGSVLPKHDLRAAHILLSLFGTRHPVHEIGAGIGTLPLLLAALGIPALGIESSQRRYEACGAVAAHVARHWDGPLAPYDFLLGRFPECVEGEDLSDKVAVITDFTCTMSAGERLVLMLALRGYGAVLLDIDRFVERISSGAGRSALIEKFKTLGFADIYDVEISSDFAFVLIVNHPELIGEPAVPQGAEAPAPRKEGGQSPPRVDVELGQPAAACDHESRRSLVELGDFEHDGGHCFRVRMPHHFPAGDEEGRSKKSPLILLQDGIRLGPPHAVHAEIRQKGGGRYSHWSGMLYFSVRDNSDPRTNGSRFHAFHPLVGLSTDNAPKQLPIGELPLGEDAELRIDLSPPFEQENGACWVRRLDALPEAASLESMADSDAAPRLSAARLYENALPLGPAHAGHAEIRTAGRGAFSHWKDRIYFSTSDNSDPNLNSRHYELRIKGPKRVGSP